MRQGDSFYPGTWMLWSRQLSAHILHPLYVGRFSAEDAGARQLHFAEGKGVCVEGFYVYFSFLIDPWDGVVTDARFQAWGPPVLLGLADVCCEVLLRKNYDQASKQVERAIQVQEKSQESMSSEQKRFVAQIVEAVQEAMRMCEGIPLPASYVPTPVQTPLAGEPYPGWDTLSVEQQIAVIEEIIAVDIRPYIELDAGGIEIVSLQQGRELVVAYKGACVSCPSSIGSTLQAIEQIIWAKVHPEIRVIPDRSFLGL